MGMVSTLNQQNKLTRIFNMSDFSNLSIEVTDGKLKVDVSGSFDEVDLFQTLEQVLGLPNDAPCNGPDMVLDSPLEDIFKALAEEDAQEDEPEDKFVAMPEGDIDDYLCGRRNELPTRISKQWCLGVARTSLLNYGERNEASEEACEKLDDQLYSYDNSL